MLSATYTLLACPQVGNESCSVHADFEAEIKQCFDAYTSTIEDTNPFGKMEGDA